MFVKAPAKTEWCNRSETGSLSWTRIPAVQNASIGLDGVRQKAKLRWRRLCFPEHIRA